jgi:hypothetical protein
MATASRSSQPLKREQQLGFALSACVHVAILLVLSLIAIGTKGSAALTLTVKSADTSQDALEISEFELEAPPEENVDQLTIDETIDIRVDVVSPAVALPAKSLTSDISEIASALMVADHVKQVAETLEAGAGAGVPKAVAAKTVAAIQGRVGKAGGKKGEVQFALAWKNINDADLHVIAPSGEQISFSHRRSNCKGMLDVDMNVDGESEEPVENVRWIVHAPAGRYTVIVNLFQVHSAGRLTQRESEFQLLATLGNETEIKQDSVSLRDRVAVFRFRYISDQVPPQQRSYLLSELERLQTQEETIAQPRLEAAKQESNPQRRDRMLSNIIVQYPHTDAAIEAMQLLGGTSTGKR